MAAGNVRRDFRRALARYRFIRVDASPAEALVGYELIGAGMLILAGDGRGFPFDYDELERWTRVGYERGMTSRKGER